MIEFIGAEYKTSGTSIKSTPTTSSAYSYFAPRSAIVCPSLQSTQDDGGLDKHGGYLSSRNPPFFHFLVKNIPDSK